MFPCSMCTAALIQAGIRRIVTFGDKIWKHDTTGDDGSRSFRMLIEAGVALYIPNIQFEKCSTFKDKSNLKPKK